MLSTAVSAISERKPRGHQRCTDSCHATANSTREQSRIDARRCLGICKDDGWVAETAWTERVALRGRTAAI